MRSHLGINGSLKFYSTTTNLQVLKWLLPKKKAKNFIIYQNGSFLEARFFLKNQAMSVLYPYAVVRMFKLPSSTSSNGKLLKDLALVESWQNITKNNKNFWNIKIQMERHGQLQTQGQGWLLRPLLKTPRFQNTKMRLMFNFRITLVIFSFEIAKFIKISTQEEWNLYLEVKMKKLQKTLSSSCEQFPRRGHKISKISLMLFAFSQIQR